MDKVLAEPFTKVVPGHGLTTDRLGINRFQAFVGQLAELARTAAENNTPLKTMLGSEKLTLDNGYGTISFAGISLGLNRKFVLRRAWEETTGNFRRKN